MNKLKNKKMKSQNGVTLIALVVTIVVLIILAVVSINMIVGDNGLIGQAIRSKQDTELEEVKTQNAFNSLTDEIKKGTTNENENNLTEIELKLLEKNKYQSYQKQKYQIII